MTSSEFLPISSWGHFISIYLGTEVVINWSAYTPSTLSIRVQFLLKSKSLSDLLDTKRRKKMKIDAGIGPIFEHIWSPMKASDRFFYYRKFGSNIAYHGATTAQIFHLCLQTCSPRFKYYAHHLCFFHL